MVVVLLLLHGCSRQGQFAKVPQRHTTAAADRQHAAVHRPPCDCADLLLQLVHQDVLGLLQGACRSAVTAATATSCCCQCRAAAVKQQYCPAATMADCQHGLADAPGQQLRRRGVMFPYMPWARQPAQVWHTEFTQNPP